MSRSPRAAALALLLSTTTAAGCGLFHKKGEAAEPREGERERWVEMDFERDRPGEPLPVAGDARAEAGALEAPAAPMDVAPVDIERRLWDQLGDYEATYLAAWRGAWAGPEPSALDVLDAFAEVAHAVGGPTGFWRGTVYRQWLGCGVDPDQAVCGEIEAAADDLEVWSTFVARIGRLGPQTAPQFLARHAPQMKRFLAWFVPERPSMTGMTRTGLYRARLAPYLAQAPTGPRGHGG